jgi:hypothetical protein
MNLRPKRYKNPQSWPPTRCAISDPGAIVPDGAECVKMSRVSDIAISDLAVHTTIKKAEWLSTTMDTCKKSWNG